MLEGSFFMKGRRQLLAFGAMALMAISGSLAAEVVDNDTGSSVYDETGNWYTSGSSGYNGGTYRYAASAYPRTATWEASLPYSGKYRVEVFYRAGGNRATSARYQITSGSNSYSSTINQRQNNLSWVSLGDFQLGQDAEVVLNAQQSSPSGTIVVADAVRFTLLEDSAEVRPAIITIFEGLDNTSTIQNLVDEVAALNYNTIMVHARYRGDATYIPNRTDSKYPNNEPRSTAVGNVDVLQEFITRGQAAGLEVIAYVNIFLTTDGEAQENRPNHVVNQHPEWRTYYYNNGAPVLQTVANEDEGLWLDPALPEVRDYSAKICADIIRNYDVDGIVVDRIRYPQTYWRRDQKDFGYHPSAIAAFNDKYGKSGVPDPYDNDWIQFRQDQVTTAIENIYYHVTKEDPDAKLYGFPIGRFDDAARLNYINSPRLLSEGLIDGVFPMIYHDDNPTFQTNVDKFTNAYSGQRIMGVAINGFRSGTNPDQKAAYARSKGMGGISFYTHASMEDFGYNNNLLSTFTSHAPVPDMPWKVVSGPSQAVKDNDNGSPVYFTDGSWSTSGSTGYNGTTYQYAFAGNNSFATWDLDPPSTGDWKVQVMYRAGGNRTSNTVYTIDHANGVEEVSINQRNNNLSWVTLGTFPFVKANGTITLDASASSGGTVVISDAVRLVKQ